MKSYNSGNNIPNAKLFNYIDQDLEKELNNISYITYVTNMQENQNSFYEYEKELKNEIDMDFTHYDKIFFDPSSDNIHTSKKGKNPSSNLKKKISDEEINRMLSESDKKIVEEVEKEIRESFYPIKNISGEDKVKAKYLIESDESIRNLVREGKINFEDIVLSVDYYELMSFMNKKKEIAVDSLKKISELFKEDDSWKILEEKLGLTINLTNTILENKLDFNSLLKLGNFSQDEAFEFATVNKIEKNEINFVEKLNSLNGEKGKSNENVIKKISKRMIKSSQIQKGRIANKINTNSNKFKSITHINNEEKDVESVRTARNYDTSRNSMSKDNKLLKSSASLRFSQESIHPSNKKVVIDLFDEQNKMTNLLKLRGERKELIKHSKATNLNSRPDLFKFNFNTPRIQIDSGDKNSEEILENKQFLEFLEIPKISAPENADKKNMIRKRIEDAVNFYKNKLK